MAENEQVRCEYGIFNADPAKICTANNVSPNNKDWAWLYDSPIGHEWDKQKAQDRVAEINFERAEEGKLDRFGPVCYKERTVTYGPWREPSND